jgi:Na+/proline symporter/nitrogen-specific signal transduction histidine kinase
MLSFNLLLTVCLIYVTGLFFVAFMAERRAKAGKLGFFSSPLTYTLSISVYCTAWTYYGAVGSAARNGLEFVTIYLGPTLVFIGWWWILRKLVRIGNTQRITSIADLISARYGKSTTLAVIITILAVIGSTPYIALQLQSLTLSFSVFAQGVDGVATTSSTSMTALWAAIGLAVFTILFGTRNLDANERHHGVVTAIALEAVVKLVALLAVGIFVVWGVAEGPSDILSRIQPEIMQTQDIFGPRWVTLIFLSATAVICLPRMFQVVVVENSDEKHLSTASWAFPLYLFLMSLFVMPIAIAGLDILPAGSNPDLFVLTIPIAENQDSLAMLAFLGGFSSATSMVIVAAIALSTMVSNHIVLPLWLWLTLRRSPTSEDVRTLLLRSRRISIAAILGLGYLYYEFTSGTGGLASIGLIAFLGVAQILPALIGGLFWESSTRKGAIYGIISGFILWAYTLFLPSFEGGFIFSAAALEFGPFGIGMLRPNALMNVSIEDPLVHAVVWSLGVNSAMFIFGSLTTQPRLIERLQAGQFIHIFDRATPSRTLTRQTTSEELHILSQRILGHEATQRMFTEAANSQWKPKPALPDPTNAFIAELEREFAGSVGAATAHAMIGQIASGEAISVEDLIAVADETAQIMEYSARLKAQSSEMEKTAEQLRLANSKLRELGEQKDAFLSQVSHELRTPMTSIRAFAEILRDEDHIDQDQISRFSSIIHDESIRLTYLLDEILDLSFLEHGKVQLKVTKTKFSQIIERAMNATQTLRQQSGAKVDLSKSIETLSLETDADRLSQVLINLISNAIKHSGSQTPVIKFSCERFEHTTQIEVTDNGLGISAENAEIIFQKFAKLSSEQGAGSAGLGLPISREIVRNLGGKLLYVGNNPGAVFNIILPNTITASMDPNSDFASLSGKTD